MNAKKSKKVLLLASLFTLAVSTAAVLTFSFNSEVINKVKAAKGVSSSIVFSRDTGVFTKIDDNTASVSGKSYGGSTYYAVSHNNADVSGTNYVAQFGFGKGVDEMYISFSTAATGTDDEAFESITGIKITTTSSTNYNFYVFYGNSFSSSVAVGGSSNPSIVSFEKPLTKLRVGVGAVPVTAKYITSIELFYDCGVEPEPVTPDHVAVYNAKNYYEVGDTFVKPEVRMIFSDTTTEVIDPDNVTCTGYNMSTAGEQTVSVSAEYKGTVYNTSYKITVTDPSSTSYAVGYVVYDASLDIMADLSDYFASTSVTPDSFTGDSLTITLNFSVSGYEVYWISILEDEDWDSFDSSDGITFVLSDLPAENVTAFIIVGEAW